MSNPQGRFQPINFLALLSAACLLLCGLASAAPSITLSKKSGPPTSQILVSGQGFKPNVAVDIYFDTKDEALVITNGKGKFEKAKIHALRNARPGRHWVTAVGRNKHKEAQQPFLVRTNWSEFQFDSAHDGLNPYENVLSPKTVKKLEVKWKTTGGVSPAIVDGVVYSISHSVDALDAYTGAELWSYPLQQGGCEGFGAVANGRVYVIELGDGDSLYALNASDGTLLWSYPADAYCVVPTVAGGLVYFGSLNHKFYALDAATGAKRWSYTADGDFQGASPAVADGVVYISPNEGNLLALDARTGVKLWSFAANAAFPIVANHVVYFGSYDGMYALDAKSGALLWKQPIVTTAAAVANGLVYGSSSDNFYALEASTGSIRWGYSEGSSVYPGFAAVANGVVFFGGLDGTIYALEANTGVFLWGYTTTAGFECPPAVANGRVYFSAYGYLYSFGLPDGDHAQTDAASKRPGLEALHPDLSLKPSKRPSIPSRILMR
jgi:outer membrane protein assembly factor BamB